MAAGAAAAAAAAAERELPEYEPPDAITALCAWNTILAIGQRDGVIRLKRGDRFEIEEAVLRGHEDSISQMVIWRGMLVSASWDKQIRLWDEDWKCVHVLKLHDDVDHLAVVGDTLVSAAWYNTIFAWSLRMDGTIDGTEIEGPPYPEAVACITHFDCIEDNQSYLVYGGYNHRLGGATVRFFRGGVFEELPDFLHVERAKEHEWVKNALVMVQTKDAVAVSFRNGGIKLIFPFAGRFVTLLEKPNPSFADDDVRDMVFVENRLVAVDATGLVMLFRDDHSQQDLGRVRCKVTLPKLAAFPERKTLVVSGDCGITLFPLVVA